MYIYTYIYIYAYIHRYTSIHTYLYLYIQVRSILQDLFERSRREFSTRGSAGLLGLLAALRAADLPRNGRYA